jgi:hypothetical protein
MHQVEISQKLVGRGLISKKLVPTNYILLVEGCLSTMYSLYRMRTFLYLTPFICESKAIRHQNKAWRTVINGEPWEDIKAMTKFRCIFNASFDTTQVVDNCVNGMAINPRIIHSLNI